MSYLNRRWVRLAILALLGMSLTACHFHGGGCRGFRFRPPVRVCR